MRPRKLFHLLMANCSGAFAVVFPAGVFAHGELFREFLAMHADTWAASHTQMWSSYPSSNVTSSWSLSRGDTATHPTLNKLERSFLCQSFCLK